jgi:hypothetical protein
MFEFAGTANNFVTAIELSGIDADALGAIHVPSPLRNNVLFAG